MHVYRDYQIMPARIADSRQIRRLEKTIFPKDAYPLIEIWLLFVLPRIRNMKALSADGQLAGFLSYSLPLGGQPSWIITIGVDKAHQRRGLGRFLMDWVEDHHALPRIRLSVRASNVPAIALYHQIGYHEIDRRRRYYNDGEDALIMEKHCRSAAH